LSPLDKALKDLQTAFADVRVDRSRSLVTVSLSEHAPWELIELGRIAFMYRPVAWGAKAGRDAIGIIWMRWA
jgi:hypothetical protein